ncbi:sugar phosphate nucleotidyltransferase [Paenibacillus eucommiae]|uniref:Mannose-1-phosphate guanylyltransferase n=1 Tax=Paenibacillus eucommiae TaxID=1355755 RepID=A0ABS4J2B6_9BACL|nr:sugar phosphate nucleotidyltransferase [Paenibacillus eucommiae]MBP1993979.1 mannose-1-phosphate guanylyltransferase [Paenibacillus eucommiae]
MKVALLSGGSGKRLWPLSNEARSKQFLKMLMNEQGEMESMVQRVWRQLESAGLVQHALIATGKGQVDILTNQLGDKGRIVVEPQRRDTFPAIALIATYLYSIVGTSLNEVVAVLPVDPYVESDFFEKLKDLETIVHESRADIALIGVKPTYPSEKYGYIVPDCNRLEEENCQDGGCSNGSNSSNSNNNSYSRVSHFKEKPCEEEAKSLIAEGAFWNCGVFAFKLNYLINLLIEKGYPIQFEEMLRQYDKLPQISFDYEVLEKANHIAVLPYEGCWKDLGTWNTLTEEMSVNLVGRGLICEESANTHVVNELDMLVTVIGVSDIVVAASPDGILVTDKASSSRLKEMLTSIEQRPMYEERRWGSYRVMDYKRSENGQEAITKLVQIKAGQSLSYHLHLNRSECWTIITGSGEFVFNNEFLFVNPGDVLQIPAGTLHSIRALSDIEFIEVQLGEKLELEDIIRLFTSWTEIEERCRMGRL